MNKACQISRQHTLQMSQSTIYWLALHSKTKLCRKLLSDENMYICIISILVKACFLQMSRHFKFITKPTSLMIWHITECIIRFSNTLVSTLWKAFPMEPRNKTSLISTYDITFRDLAMDGISALITIYMNITRNLLNDTSVRNTSMELYLKNQRCLEKLTAWQCFLYSLTVGEACTTWGHTSILHSAFLPKWDITQA